MVDSLEPHIELLKAAYASFNLRKADEALAVMTSDVVWPRAFKGGTVDGQEAVKSYWLEQWGEIDPAVEPVSFAVEGDDIRVTVHQVVRDLSGNVLADGTVFHRFSFRDQLISKMEIVD